VNSDHLASHLIVAKESLDDRNFSRTVVLLIQHDDDGTFGVVLNRMLPVGLETIWEQLSETTSVIDRPVHAGGPVEGPLMCLHESPEVADREVLGGVYFTSEKDRLEMLASQSNGRAQFFVGFAGWGPGQLESEIKSGSWMIAKAEPSDIFERDPMLWALAIRRARGEWFLGLLGIEGSPFGPTVN